MNTMCLPPVYTLSSPHPQHRASWHLGAEDGGRLGGEWALGHPSRCPTPPARPHFVMASSRGGVGCLGIPFPCSAARQKPQSWSRVWAAGRTAQEGHGGPVRPVRGSTKFIHPPPPARASSTGLLCRGGGSLALLDRSPLAPPASGRHERQNERTRQRKNARLAEKHARLK